MWFCSTYGKSISFPKIKRGNDNLEQQAQALFKAWFVDFEPFKDGEFVDSELGMIPKGWKVVPLKEIANISSGKRPPQKHSEKDNFCSIPIVGASSVMGYTSETLFTDKILIIGRVGTLGIVQRYSSKCWASDNTLVITSLQYEYLYNVLLNIDYNSLNRGTSQPLITQTDINNILVIQPTKSILTKFEYICGSLMKRCEHNKIEIEELSSLRDTLLPKLMSGELKINELNS